MTGRRVPIGTVANRYGVPATTLRYLKAAIEECLACGCQQPQRCRLLTLPPIDWCTD